jgi:hypothetical protein
MDRTNLGSAAIARSANPLLTLWKVNDTKTQQNERRSEFNWAEIQYNHIDLLYPLRPLSTTSDCPHPEDRPSHFPFCNYPLLGCYHDRKAHFGNLIYDGLSQLLQGFGFTPNWTTLVGLRVILGVLEAGFFPCCAYLLSCWYPRYHLQKRNAVFYLIGSMASALSGILAYGLMQMQGLGGLAGWRWIFVVGCFK